MKNQLHSTTGRNPSPFFLAWLALVATLACQLVTGPAPAPLPVLSSVPPSAAPPVTPTLASAPEPSVSPVALQSSIVEQNPRNYRVEFVATVRNAGFSLNKLLIYQPRPIEWNGQRNVTVEMVSPTPTKQGADLIFGNGLYYWNVNDLPRAGQSLPITIRFTYTAYELAANIDPNEVQPYDKEGALYKLYTRPEKYIESSDLQIVAIANQVAAGEENPYLLARKFYDYVIETFQYRLVGKGLLGAKALINNREGECGDYASMFIALARAKGIPARSVVGYWAISGVEQTHVWAEFYLEGIGWVPVDPTIGQQSASKQEYYFGNMDNQRVILEKGFSFPMDPPAPDNYLAPLMQGPAWWFWGDGDGNTMSTEVTRWDVSSIP
jgi:transglutaminase-like putative cysteine protease